MLSDEQLHYLCRWRPNIGVGPFIMGQVLTLSDLARYVSGCSVSRHPGYYAEIIFDIDAIGLSIDIDGGVIDGIHCAKHLFFRSHNIIYKNINAIESACDLVRTNIDGPYSFTEEWRYVYEYDDEELMLWVGESTGLVVEATVLSYHDC